MKEFFIICSILLLSGFPGSGDRLPETLYADVKIEGNAPCVLYPVNLGDRITSIQITSEKEASFRKLFDDVPFRIVSGQCLPTFGYHFKNDRNYVVYYGLDNDKSKRQKLIQANFYIGNLNYAVN
ncbi:putative T6SS immunity periplasmic lipoprotein [Serratia rhizosphaerae]